MTNNKRRIGQRDKRGFTRKKILLVLAESNGKLEFSEIRKCLGMAKSTIHTHLATLKAYGLVDEVNGAWVLSVVSRPGQLGPDFIDNKTLREEWLEKWIKYQTWFTRWSVNPLTGKGEEIYKLPNGELKHMEMWTDGERKRLQKSHWYRNNVHKNVAKLRFDQVFTNAITTFTTTMTNENEEMWSKFDIIIEKKCDGPFTWIINSPEWKWKAPKNAKWY